MNRNRFFWYDFFADLGFLVMPCGFNSRSTTQWLFDSYQTNQDLPFSTETYRIRLSGLHCFFYRLNDRLLQTYLPLMRFTDQVIRQRLDYHDIELDIPADYPDSLVQTVRPYENKSYVNGFPLIQHIFLLGTIIYEIDPLDWGKEVTGADIHYVNDFITYGMCYLSIERRR